MKIKYWKNMKFLIFFIASFSLSLIVKAQQCNISYVKQDVTQYGATDGSIILDISGLSCSISEPSGCINSPLPPEDYCNGNYPFVSGEHVNISSGTYRVPHGFNGGLSMSGGTLIICGTPNFSYFNYNGGDIIVIGNLNLYNIHANSTNSKIYNYGTIQCGNITFAGTLYNHGTIQVQYDFNVNSGATFENTGSLIVTNSFNNNGTAINKGSIDVLLYDFKNNSTGVFTNYCTIKV